MATLEKSSTAVPGPDSFLSPGWEGSGCLFGVATARSALAKAWKPGGGGAWPPGSYHGLEAGMQLGQEGRLPGQGQHPLLHHRALHVIILDDHVLFQDLHGVQFICAFSL